MQFTVVTNFLLKHFIHLLMHLWGTLYIVAQGLLEFLDGHSVHELSTA